MKAEHVIAQMQLILPKKTDLFSTKISTALSYSAGTVTGVTATAHGLTTGDYVTISGTLTKTVISSLTFAGGVATAVTSSDHDLTQGYQSTVTIEGANQTEYNGTFALLTVPNRRTFTFSVSGSPVTPATGTPVLLEDKLASYNGRHQITVVNSTTYTYITTNVLSATAGGSPVTNTEVRVSGAITVERALEAYTEQPDGNYWAFVVLGDTDISRDRSILSDVNIHLTGKEKKRIREIENVMVAVVIPSTNSIAGREERDKVDDVKVALYKTLFGFKVPSSFSEERQAILVPIGDRFFGYEKAYYAHIFDFQTVQDIVWEDGVEPADNAAFRDMQINFENDFSEVIMQTDINLDEVSL